MLQAMGHICSHTKTYLGFAATWASYNSSHFSSIETSIEQLSRLPMPVDRMAVEVFSSSYRSVPLKGKAEN